MTNFSSNYMRSYKNRLPNLLAYLSQDPENDALLGDAFDAAYSERNWEVALKLAEIGSKAIDKLPGWQLRTANVLIAKGEMEEARTLLLSVSFEAVDSSDFQQAVSFNLAYIDFSQARFDDCVNRLRPWVDGEDLPRESPSRLVCSQLWLRALHQNSDIEQAMEWASQRSSSTNFGSELGAIASLIAIDAGNLDIAERWAESGLSESMPLEGWVSHASLALGRNDAAKAELYAKRAVELSPLDGRSWSALAFVHLAMQNMAEADACFIKATNLIPNHVGTWHGRAWSALLQNNLDLSEKYFDKAVSLDRNFADSHGGLAVLYYRSGRREDAINSSNRALRLDANSLTAKFALALLAGQIDSQDAVHAFARHAGVFHR